MKFFWRTYPSNMDYHVLHPDGWVEEVTLPQWAEWFNTSDRKIGDHTIEGSNISTVFIGVDSLLFETMIFGGELDGYQVRSRTKEDALAEHEKAVNLVKESPTLCIECNGKLEPECTDTCRQCETKLKNDLARL